MKEGKEEEREEEEQEGKDTERKRRAKNSLASWRKGPERDWT